MNKEENKVNIFCSYNLGAETLTKRLEFKMDLTDKRLLIYSNIASKLFLCFFKLILII